MSNSVFPTGLTGILLTSNRTPLFATTVQKALSGKETRIARMAYPMWKWELGYEVLRDDLATSDLKTIVGFFASMQGQWDTFLYTDPYWNTVTAQQFGTGDGSTTAFQLSVIYNNSGGYGIPEAIQNLNGTPSVYVNGTLTTVSVGSTGIVTFSSAPASGAALTWTGSWYYRCRFLDDTLTLTEILKKWWELKKLQFQSVKI